MAFYGLSIDVWNGHDVTGTSLADDSDRLLFRTDAETVTMTAGDSFVVAAFGRPSADNMPTVDDELAISWVLEVDQASAGAVRLSTGTTSGLTIDHTACTEALGVHDATGPVTVAAAQTSYTLDGYLDRNTKTNLFVECLSGTVVLRQAKVRVWPAAGPGGAWVAASGVVGSGGGVKTGRLNHLGLVFAREDSNAGDHQGAITAATAAAQASLAALAGTTYASSIFDDLIAEGEARVQSHAGSSGVWLGQALLSDNYGWVYAKPSDYPAQNPTGARDPREVFGEPGAEVRQPDGSGADVLGSFEGWTGSLKVTSGTSGHVPAESWTSPYGWPVEGGTLHQVTVPMVDTADNTLRPYEPMPGGGVAAVIPTAPGLAQADTLVPLSGGPCLLILARPAGVFGDAPTAIEHTLDGAPEGEFWDATHSMRVSEGPDGLAFDIAYPDFLYYDPTAKPAPTRPPRFYVTYTEVDEDPRDASHVVGIGKPADDRSVFRVPTPLGTLRELRHGETVSDVSVAYPLKVKLEDGSWTVVAGMTPDD